MTWAASWFAALLLVLPVGATELPAKTRSDRPAPFLTEDIGTGVRDANGSATKRYDLKLVFANRPDHLPVASVGVRILDTRGSEVLSADNAASRFFTDLPAGIYRVTATADGRAIEHTVEIGKGAQTELSFFW